MADLIANMAFAGFISYLLIGIIKSFIKDSSRNDEDATPKLQTKEKK